MVSLVRISLLTLVFSSGCYLAAAADKDVAPVKTPSALFEAFQLGPYLKDQSIEDITDAIQVAWQFDQSRSDAAIRLKFHQTTKQLFVSDSKEAIELVRRVVAQLNPVLRSPLGLSVANPTPEDEQRRLEAVAAEVRRRRGLREGAPPVISAPPLPAPVTVPAPPARTTTPNQTSAPVPATPSISAPVTPAPMPIDSKFNAEIQRRRETRAAADTKAIATAPVEKK